MLGLLSAHVERFSVWDFSMVFFCFLIFCCDVVELILSPFALLILDKGDGCFVNIIPVFPGKVLIFKRLFLTFLMK